MTDKLDEATIRACIAALPKYPISFGPNGVAVSPSLPELTALEALLPKRDPAEALVEEFAGSLGRGDSWSKLAFAQWLLDNDRIKG